MGTVMARELSQELLDHFRNFLDADWQEDIPAEEREDAALARKLAAELATIVVLSRERLTQVKFDEIESVIEGGRDLVESELNEHYAIRELENAPSLVRRTLRLSALSAKDSPSKQTNLYISEASRTFIRGFFNTSVVLSRAALEQGLEERLGAQGDGEDVELARLIKDARKWNLLSATSATFAFDLKKRSNGVLHESPIRDEEAALEVLIGVRSVLEEIFSAEGHF
jgi:hypothetical protein